MKRNLAVIVGVLISTVMFAGGIKDPVTRLAVVNKAGTSTYKVYYKSNEVTDVKISIIDAKNNLVFAEKLSNVAGFVRPYNFEELSEGEYTVQIEDNAGIKKEKVTYHAGVVKGLFNVIKLSEANKYMVTASGKGDQTITIKIYNSEGETLYDGSSQMNQEFAKVFKLEKISGDITFEVTNSDGASRIIKF